MDSLIPLLLLSACSCATSELLSQAIKRRSDVFGVYASEYAREYEPVAYVAIPLHSPMPVLRILSSAPLDARDPRPGKLRKPPASKPNVYASSMTHSWYATPRAPQDTPHSWYNKPQSSNPAPMWYRPRNTDTPSWYKQQSSETSDLYYKPQSSDAPSLYYKPQSSDPSPAWYDNPNSVEETPVILYAKPNDYGGFTYRNGQTKKKKNVKKPQKEPIILRIHKYRIIRDR